MATAPWHRGDPARDARARFFQTATLVLQLGKAKRDGWLDRLMADIGRAEMLVLDEFGYVPFDVDGARLLYQVISDSYERRSIVFTTNVEFSRWGHGLRGRQAGCRDRGPGGPPRKARRVRGPSHRLEESPHAGQVRNIGACPRPSENFRGETRKKGSALYESEA